MPDTKHAFGALPDTPDPRDFTFKLAAPVALPPSVDLRSQCSPVRDQGPIGSCTGEAAVALREFLEIKAGGKPLTVLSPLWVYYQERLLENSVPTDAGAMPRDAMKVLLKSGCAPELDWPYAVSKFAKKPTAKSNRDALPFRIKVYQRLTDLNAMQVCLAGGYAFTLGFLCYPEIETVGPDGILPLPKPGESAIGGHDVLCCGYATNPSWPGGGALLCKNSWGVGYGMAGFFWLTWGYVTPERVTDAWTASL